MSFDGDEDTGTFHLGAKTDGVIVAISTWLPRPFPGDADAARPAYQLRGMASHPDHRGSGAAAAVLASGIAQCRALGADTVWARARTAAIGFYDHHGFSVSGDVYVDTTTGLPHRNIVCHLR